MLASAPRSGASSFLGTHTNKIDAKGRVQAPADFRRALDLASFNGFFCFPNLDTRRLDCGGADFVEDLKALIATLDPYSQAREDLEIAMLGEIQPIPFDQNGRFILTKRLRDHLGEGDQVRFVGRGDTFQIWPTAGAEEAVNAHRERARAALRRLRHPGARAIPSPEDAAAPSGGDGS
ncbi:MAG: division/cell wall cluster transcriptional repressor MraZ [Alphaproteobacteria bacterium]|nr:division/cell wall cluster transcriptional repressor MraZ [Alphaproteobacteria bacterium]